MVSKVAIVDFEDYDSSITKALDIIKAGKQLSKQKKIIIKPNLTLASKPPVTTDVNCVKGLLNYIAKVNKRAEVVIAEGSGDCDTDKAFEKLGYLELAERYGVDLVDLNQGKFVKLKNPRALVLKEFYLPKVLNDGFLISVPTLKEHGSDKVTISMKNMFGIAPGELYGKGSGSWLKTKLHEYGVWQSIVDICSYRKIDLAVVDAALGLYGCAITGRVPKPPLNVIIAGFDAVSVDSVGAKILGHNWKDVRHLNYANNILGTADLSKIEIFGELVERPNKSRRDKILRFIIEKADPLKNIPGVKRVGKAILTRI